MKNISTSIVVPVYNTEKYLDECLKSIEEQSGNNFEIIIVDDGSTDGSSFIIERWKDHFENIKVIKQSNKGLSNARNVGIRNAEGKYIQFIDSDDMIKKETIEYVNSISEEMNLDVLMFDAEPFGELCSDYNAYDRSKVYYDFKKPISGKDVINQYFSRGMWPSACLLYLSREFILSNDILFREGVLYEDNEFYCRVLYHASKVFYIPQKFYKRRYRKNSITTSVFSEKKAFDLLNNAFYIKNIDSKNKELCRYAYGLVNTSVTNMKLHGIELSDSKQEEYLRDVVDTLPTKLMDYELIKIAMTVSGMFPNRTVYDLEVLKDRRDEILCDLFREIGLFNSSLTIGIYGTGKNGRNILNEYHRLYSGTKPKLFFINSKVAEGAEFMGQTIYDIHSIGFLKIDVIVLTSPSARSEMKSMVEKLYGDKYIIREVDFVI